MIVGNAQSLLVVLTIFLGIIFFVIYIAKRRRLYELSNSMPGPFALPFFGNAFHAIRFTTEDIIDALTSLFATYPFLFRAWAGPHLVVCVEDPHYLKSILWEHKQVQKPHLLDNVMGQYSKNGLMTAPLGIWRRQRKLINPTLYPSALKHYFPTFVATTKIFVKKLENVASSDRELNIFPLLSSFTMDTICQTAMGIDMKVETTRGCPFRIALDRFAEIAGNRLMKVWLHPNMIFNATKSGREQKQLTDQLHNYTRKIIQSKKELILEMKKSPTVIDDENYTDIPTRKKDFLDMILEIASKVQNFSDEQVLGEVNSMVATGNETTALASSYLMLVLASCPDVQDKIYEELRDIYGTDDERDVTLEDLTRMEYMERVIKETLRFFPIVPILNRKPTKEIDLGDYTIPKDTTIILSIATVQRNEKYWPNPLEFDPDRFLPKETAKRHPYAYLPFGAGPRNCIGENYAMMLLKVICATIVRKFIIQKDNITPVGKIKLKVEITLKPVDGFELKFKRRKPERIRTV